MPQGPSHLAELEKESRDEADEEARRSAPLAPGETLDPNRSSEEDLDRLPGIGPATARSIIEEREEGGGFVVPEDLLRVPGIGPSRLARISPHLDFSAGVPRGLKGHPEQGRGREEQGATTGGSGIDVNRASAQELQSLPGIGPALAQRIVEDRTANGPLQEPGDLLRIRGIGPVVLSRIRHLISTGG